MSIDKRTIIILFILLILIAGGLLAWQLKLAPEVNQFFASEPTPTAQIRTITTTHRFEEGKMFGGWGPHLGHLLRAPDNSLWFADDTGNDVTKNPAIAYYHLVGNDWVLAGTQATYGTVQQNMGSIMKSNSIIYSYGIDIENHRVEECYFSTLEDYSACNLLPFPLDTQANYIGAGVSPSGTIMVWWTNVSDGGGGSLEYIYNSGLGWVGPLKNHISGFNDVSYINIAFINDTRFALLAQSVSGLAPNWTYGALYTTGELGTPIGGWQTLGPLTTDNAIVSTNDIWVDQERGVHVLTRTANGGSAYYYQSPDSSISGPLYTIPSRYRSRFVTSHNKELFIVFDTADGMLKYYTYAISNISGAVPFATLPLQSISLPIGFGYVYAIYPESRTYQTTLTSNMNVAVTGDSNQGLVIHLELLNSLLTPTPTATATPSQKPADLDGNGLVDIFDYNTLVSDFGKTGALLSDIDGNSVVNIFDYNTLVSDFGK